MARTKPRTTKPAPKLPSKKAAAPKKAAAKPIKAPVETVKAPPKTTATKRKRADEDLAADATASKKTKTSPTKATTKAAPKKSATKKSSTTTTKEPAATATKRKRTEDAAADTITSTKRPRTEKKGPVINEAPTQKLNVYVCGENSSGELGLGTAKIAKDVRRPRLNAFLDMNTVGVVQLECGGMHAIALTYDNKVLTWGVNDSGALGRDTKWEGGTRDMDAEDSESEDSESPNGLNPFEASPAEVDWSQTALPENTKFTHVAAGDSCSFVVTDDGRVYGWGTFRDSSGVFGFTTAGDTVTRPVLIPRLTKIASVSCGANSAFALTKSGAVYSWGCGELNQLGRRLINRFRDSALTPHPFGLPTGKKGIASIHPGNDHCFAISKTGDVYAWGLNNYCETGIPEGAGADKASITNPTIVESLKGKEVVDMAGGSHHSIAATRSGECLAWGRVDSHQLGIEKAKLDKLPDDAVLREAGKLRIVVAPQKVDIDGEVVQVAAASDHSLAVTKDGEAYSWGFNVNYQTGQGGEVDDVNEATLIDNTAVRGKELVGAGSGGQFSVLLGV